MNAQTVRKFVSSVGIFLIIFTSFLSFNPTSSVKAEHTANPSNVGLAGSLQSELGCPGDWQPECANTHLAYDTDDDAWQAIFNVPAGNWEYKAALNNAWGENYGVNATPGGANIPLSLAAPTNVKFYYSHQTHWVTDNQNSVIAVAAGSFQSELGCPGDWQENCLRSWLQDPDGNGVYSFSTSALLSGNYESKVTINESWAENYGLGGVQNGPNIPFSVPSGGADVTFNYNATTHVLEIQVVPLITPPTPVTLVGSLQSELGCAGNWDPACTATDLNYDANDDIYQRTFPDIQNTHTLPAGNFEYKVALDHSWAVNYGRYAELSGDNIPLSADGNSIKFYFDPKSHWITDNKNSIIAVAPGNFQSELGCSGDWDPGCLRSWLQDPDEDGIYVFETTALPAGSYEGKVALDESWDVNYGQGGVQDGPNIPFFVPYDNAKVTFIYDATTHILTILSGFGPDNNIAWDGLRHDSRDLLYRTPGGAVPAGTTVKLRFRTFHNDVTGVKARIYDINANGQQLLPMQLAASDVDCYQEGLPSTCDFWEVTLTHNSPNNLWYRFIVTDGTDTDYYADDTPALDGGLGSTSEDAIDRSYALMFYDSEFTSPAWAQDAVIYQIFPDRFRSGRSSNNPHTGDIRYDDPVLALPWGTLPEGYCRNYADGDMNCPWRFDDTPPDWSPAKEGPRGRDYMGGDLRGVTLKLDYLKSLGVTTIYFNPIFDAGSNHSYDTQDYYMIDPYFGTQGDFQKLVTEARKRGIRIVLDGVFNHMSSDSPLFDRYHHYDTVGACESLDSPYRDWFEFRNDNVPCDADDYEGWFGFDSIPVLNKENPEVQAYFLTGEDSVSRYWLHHGTGGWRMDVSGDPSFPTGYWETFREVTKETEPEALLISETWQKDSTLLRMLRGDRLDTTMNYRLRDAVIGLLTPGNFDSKGFGDSGYQISPSQFAARLESVREDYPDAAYYSLMNLLDSHDTERLLWTLTPGTETTADKELNAANLANGKNRQMIASLIQFTVPGAPTVYYGDEVAMTGDDDPDDRRTYPWVDLGGNPDTAMFSHYQTLASLREDNAALTAGDFQVLLADDAAETVAYGRKTTSQAAIVVLNRSDENRTVEIPLAGYVPDGIAFTSLYGVANAGSVNVQVAGGTLSVELAPWSAWLLATDTVDLQPPAAPSGLTVTAEGNGEVSLEWGAVAGSAGYNLYRSPVSGGGWVKVNNDPLNLTSFTDTGLQNGRTYYYIVTALDASGNESDHSNEVDALPHLTIGWANLQWPPTINHTISTTDRTDDVYGQVWINGATDQPGPTPSLIAQLGFGPDGSDPDDTWVWVDASFNTDVGNNDEFVASMLPDAVGIFDYAYRYSTTNGNTWIYADLNGTDDGYSPAQAGNLTVNASDDTTSPATPTGLHVVSASPAGVDLSWEPVSGDPTLYGYEVLRSNASGGPYTMIARITSTSYTDTLVVEGVTYYYVVRALDQSFNRSGNSSEVEATAELRTVSVTFNVTVPATTDATGRSVYIAGTLSRLDGGLPDWDPGGVVLTQVDATHWTITLTGKETTQIAYKYALGSWDYVEKGPSAACAELSDRQLTLSYGMDGTQTVNDTVDNWRNVAPCGN